MTERHVENDPVAKRVLIVDDDPGVRESVELLMTTLGLEVTTVDRGQTAVELFQDDQQLFDWAIIDVSMPGMDGIETARRIRNTHPGLPIVLATGYSDVSIPDELMQQPNTALIQKPYRGEAILQILALISP